MFLFFIGFRLKYEINKNFIVIVYFSVENCGMILVGWCWFEIVVYWGGNWNKKFYNLIESI